ncbi:MAG: ACT domain-containing protein [Betaproteobacteria bacterium]|nr:ACT domain-containing protein [Betaproteobacteria bacterium]
MTAPLSHLPDLLRSMQPQLHEGVYVFSELPAGADPGQLPFIALMREAEGLTIVLPEAEAMWAGLPILYRAAWITLTVHSDLQAVGLTAAFAGALGEAGISCNVIAGAHHDHLFVPYAQADAAMAALENLQRNAAASGVNKS